MPVGVAAVLQAFRGRQVNLVGPTRQGRADRGGAFWGGLEVECNSRSSGSGA